LLAAAKRANKIDAGYRIPDKFLHNTPDRLEDAFARSRRAGLFSEYPFGTDLTREEIDLARALRWLQEHTQGKVARAWTVARGLPGGIDDAHRAHLERLALAPPRGFSERLTAKLVNLGL